ncbi:MAG: site-specific DNA-methyltransferase [Candidatus Heimdallarchaeota archaeon]|nr:MAG: site-specific DNA-methyltransferase [Candidatus Heimdallarchaeota archaeon]
MEPQIDPRNKLNALTGREWIRFTKSWFIADGKPSDISHEIDLHPASFPPSMIKEFIEFFTKPGDRVIDPFVGTGSTLVACDECGRQGVGIELYEKYVKTTQARTESPVYQGDAREIIQLMKSRNEKFVLCITSPPYWQILKKKKDYNQQERLQKGLDLKYGEHPKDLGMIEDPENFLFELVDFFNNISDLLEERGHLVIFVQNIRDKGEINPIAFNLGLELNKAKYKFLGERIWLQNQKTLRPYGYPYAFVPNIHHHYALIFQRK